VTTRSWNAVVVADARRASGTARSPRPPTVEHLRGRWRVHGVGAGRRQRGCERRGVSGDSRGGHEARRRLTFSVAVLRSDREEDGALCCSGARSGAAPSPPISPLSPHTSSSPPSPLFGHALTCATTSRLLASRLVGGRRRAGRTHARARRSRSAAARSLSRPTDAANHTVRGDRGAHAERVLPALATV
jgi:hypothetical protein